MLESVLVVGLALGATAGGDGAMPSPLWRGVTRVVLVCDGAIEPALCDALHAAARSRSALPVVTDPVPAMLRDRATVVVSVAFGPSAIRSELVAVARRAVEIDDAEAPARQAVAWQAASPAAAANDLMTRILPRRTQQRRWAE